MFEKNTKALLEIAKKIEAEGHVLSLTQADCNVTQASGQYVLPKRLMEIKAEFGPLIKAEEDNRRFPKRPSKMETLYVNFINEINNYQEAIQRKNQGLSRSNGSQNGGQASFSAVTNSYPTQELSQKGSTTQTIDSASIKVF